MCSHKPNETNDDGGKVKQMGFNESTGSRLKEARKDAHLTQAKLGEASGYTSQFISDLERGKKLTLQAARNLSKALNVCTEWLMCESDLKTPHDKDLRRFHLLDSYEYGNFSEFLRKNGHIVECYDDNFIIIPDNIDPDQDWGVEPCQPLICSDRDFQAFSDHFLFMQFAMAKSFFKTCAVGTAEDWLIAKNKGYTRKYIIERKCPFSLVEVDEPSFTSEQSKKYFFSIEGGKKIFWVEREKCPLSLEKDRRCPLLLLGKTECPFQRKAWRDDLQNQ